MMRERWPVNENGIALPPYEVRLPQGRTRKTNNHHTHWESGRYERSMALCAMRDLSRHQFEIPIDVHQWIHKNFDMPELPTEEQAAREVVDAYDRNETFKIYDRFARKYFEHEIPQYLVDAFICKYSLARVYSMAAD